MDIEQGKSRQNGGCRTVITELPKIEKVSVGRDPRARDVRGDGKVGAKEGARRRQNG